MGPRGWRTTGSRAVIGALIAAALTIGGVWAAAPTPAQVPVIPIGGNPTPLTDVFGSSVMLLTGGTKRICATSGLGIPVTCVEHLNVQPSLPPTAAGTTFAHWVYCKNVCVGQLLSHELVHVRQFETYGDSFGPLYLVEAAQYGTGCANKWEREAYEANGGCP
jgi:hypothetical protein